MEVERFCDMVPVSKQAMRKAWFFISYFASDELELPPQAIYMVWRREKRTPEDTAPMIVGLIQFGRTVRENKLIKIPGIHSAGPTKSFEYGFAYFSTVSWKVTSQVHVLGPIEELDLEIPFYQNLCMSEQEIAEEDMKKLLALVDQKDSLMDLYIINPSLALKWHSFLELAFKQKDKELTRLATRRTGRRRGQLDL